MLEKLLNEIELMVTEGIEENLLNEPNYNKSNKKCIEQYEILKSKLPKEEAFKLIDRLESSYEELRSIATNFYYKQGISDGMVLHKELKSFGSINPKGIVKEPSKYSCEFEKEYENLSDEERSEYLNLSHYVYVKAYESGFKAGHKEALT